MTGARDDLRHAAARHPADQERVIEATLGRIAGVASIEPGFILAQEKCCRSLPIAAQWQRAYPFSRSGRRARVTRSACWRRHSSMRL